MKEEKHKFSYDWTLKDAVFTKDAGKVFSCFACGGGSTMGYKLAGFDVIGCNEIDPRMMAAYQANHHPKYAYCEDIRTFKDRDDLPEELYHLDILDGSPPCSSFSTCGEREKGWGKKKKFREGQTEQVLDTLFFDFIDLAKRLQPKVVIAENVKGLTVGNAKDYMKRIYEEFANAGYTVQHHLLDAQYMGVPQKRERVIFLCLRNDLVSRVPCRETLFDQVPIIDMTFNEPPIVFGEIRGGQDKLFVRCDSYTYHLWENRLYGDIGLDGAYERMTGKRGFFNQRLAYNDKVCYTLTTRSDNIVLFDEPRSLTNEEVVKISSFPSDYDFADNPQNYICGMSVPPVMMAQIATRVKKQWINKIR